MTTAKSNDNKTKTNSIMSLPLSYVLSLLSQFFQMPVHIFKSDNHYLEKFNIDSDDDLNVLKTDFALREKVLKLIRNRKVGLVTDEKPFVFGGVVCNDDLTLVIGPIVIADIDQNLSKLYALKHKANNVSPLRCDVRKLAAILLLFHSAMTNEHISINDFLDANFLSLEVIESTKKQIANIISRQSLTNKPHNPSVFEDSIRLAIKNGDEETLKKSLNSMYASMRGTLSRNELRSAKNLAIVDITIATRAAIDAGLSAEELYVISDAFIMEVEECKFPSDAQALARACALRCTQLVARHKTQMLKSNTNSLVVARACEYIERHVYDKFNVQKLCEKLKVSSSYLSKLFKDEKKITLGEYYRNRKIEVAKILLTTTSKDLSEISSLLNFNSQSHFGRIFMQVVGTTPSKYRNKNAFKDPIL